MWHIINLDEIVIKKSILVFTGNIFDFFSILLIELIFLEKLQNSYHISVLNFLYALQILIVEVDICAR